MKIKEKYNSLSAVIRDTTSFVLNTYKRKPEAFVKARGSWLTSISGRKILDFFPGWGVSNLGHCPPRLVRAVSAQVKKILHVANVFHIPEQTLLAKRLVSLSFRGKVFFCNSGTEAVECAIKTAKAWGKHHGRDEIVSFCRSFHGRTMGALSVTAQSHYQSPFTPLLPGIKHAEFNNLDSLKSVICAKTCAVILELIQGEGGVNIADKTFIKSLYELSREKNFLLIFDEVQTGFGRTGKMFAFQNFGIKPDMMCLSKSLANGIPMGACIVAESLADVMKPGMHASTFGGNYVASSAALAVLDTFEKDKILEKMKPVQKTLSDFFSRLASEYRAVKSFRHLGMMFGIEMHDEYAGLIADKALREGLVINCTSGNVLRIMPALNLSMKDCKTGMRILERIFKDVCKN